MKIGVFIALSLVVLVTLLPVACTATEVTTTTVLTTTTTTTTVTTTTTTTTPTPTTTRPATEPPTEEELRALNFARPDLPRITVEKLKLMGVNDIIIDPGFGFGKTIEHNYQLLKHLDDFKIFELP